MGENQFQTNFVQMGISITLIALVYHRWQLFSQGNVRLEFQEIPNFFLALCFLALFVIIWWIGYPFLRIILSQKFLKFASNRVFIDSYQWFVLRKLTILNIFLDSRKLLCRNFFLKVKWRGQLSDEKNQANSAGRVRAHKRLRM